MRASLLLALPRALGYEPLMKLVDILEPSRIIHRLQATTKSDVVREIVRRGFVQRENNTELGIADEDRVVRVFEERERMGSTGLKDGLAIPHGKLERIDQLLACLALSDHGIDYGALDGKPSHIFVALLAPESGAGLHLKALARVSRVFAVADLQTRLLEAGSADDVWDIIAAEDAKYG